jgi:hypothetical protein
MRVPAGKWVALSGLAALLLTLGMGGAAAANLATLNGSTARAKPGAIVSLTGASFAVPRPDSGVAPTPVVIHWQGEEGRVLAEAVPDQFGSISAVITVPPDATPGIYVLVGTQRTPRLPAGAQPGAAPTLVAEPGTPARMSFEVLGPGAVSVRAPVPVGPVEARSDLDSTVWVVLTAASGAVAMSLFGGGLIAFIHQSRQAKLPAEARWIPPGWYR